MSVFISNHLDHILSGQGSQQIAFTGDSSDTCNVLSDIDSYCLDNNMKRLEVI